MNLQEFFYSIKKSFGAINALVNSAQTPEEFLQKGEAPPSILSVRKFLTSYDLRRIIKLQLFNNSTNLFIHNGFYGFIIGIKLVNIDKELLMSLFAIGYPKQSTMSIFFQHDINGSSNCYLTVTTKIPKKNTESRIQKQLLKSIMDKMLNKFQEYNVSAQILKPKHLIILINSIMVHQQYDAKYSNDKFIFEQLMPYTNNNISNDGVLDIANIPHKVFYTRQYPNITNEQVDDYLERFIQMVTQNKINFHYCININLDSEELNTQKIYEFHTTLVIKDLSLNNDLEKLVQGFFRYELGWYIYRNQLSPFQQFLDSIPFQFDYSSVERLSNASITQKLPVNKLIELFPVETREC